MFIKNKTTKSGLKYVYVFSYIMVFIGRRRELRKLENLYSVKESVTCAIYGRRRVGKTSLIQEFSRNKRVLFFTTTGSTKEVILYNLSLSLTKFFEEEVKLTDFFDFMKCLRAAIQSDEKTVIVFDEFPFLVREFPDIVALLQVFIDHDMKESDVMLILSGSSMGAMKSCLNDGDSPLFMRFPVQMKITPLSYPEARLFHEGYSEEDRVRAYAIAGGVPMYHNLLNGKNLEERIEDLFLTPSGLLGSEATNVLSLELKPWDSYEKILLSISNGNKTMDEIVQMTGLSKTYCQGLIDNLVMLDVVAEELPLGRVRKKSYKLIDGLFSFYYNVIMRNEVLITISQNNVFESFRRAIDTFYGRRFEDICRQYILGNNACRWIGRWWGSVPVRQNGIIVRGEGGRPVTENTDVDIVALTANDGHDDMILCECKFTQRIADVRVAEELIRRGESVRKDDRNKRYVIFSRSGFADSLVRYAEDFRDGRLELVDLETFGKWAENFLKESGCFDIDYPFYL